MARKRHAGSFIPALALAALAFAGGWLGARHSGEARAAERGPRHVLVVLSNAHPGTDEAFNDWYTNVHLADVIALPAFTGARRYRLASAQLDAAGGAPYRYLAIYDVGADDVAAARDLLASNVDDPGGMSVDPSLDLERTVAWFYTPITGHVTR